MAAPSFERAESVGRSAPLEFESTVRPVPPAATGRPSVLVIDDEHSVLLMRQRVLTEHGWEVITVDRAETGLSVIDQRRIDVVLTDLQMPGLDGKATIEAIKQRAPNIEVVVSTGHASLTSAVTCMKLGAFDFVEKTAPNAELVAILTHALEKRRASDIIALYRNSAPLLGVRDPIKLAYKAAQLARTFLEADAAAVVKLTTRGDELQTFVDTRTEEHPSSKLLGLLLRRVIADRAPLLITNLAEHEHLTNAADRRFESALVYPLFVEDQIIGIFALLRTHGERAFTEAESERAGILTDQIALALENALLHGRLSLAHREAQNAESRLRAVMNGALDASVTMDVTARIVDFNSAAERMFGWKRGVVLGQGYYQVLFDAALWDEHRARFEECLSARFDEARAQPFTTQCLRSQSESVHVEMTLKPIRAGDHVHVCAFIQDMSEAKRLEVELRHAQKLEAVGRLAAGAAHEINTPMQFIGDNVHFLRESMSTLLEVLRGYRRLGQPSSGSERHGETAGELLAFERERDVEYIERELPAAADRALGGIHRVKRILDAMKRFSSPDGDAKTSVDVKAALTDALILAAADIEGVADVELELGDVPNVYGYRHDLNHVFLHLIVNAAHAIAETNSEPHRRGTIRIAASAGESSVTVAISDTGCGIPMAMKDRVFEPFFTTKVGKGTGQGLALSRTIVVEKHRGQLTFESAEGKGTTFFVRLPVAEDPGGTEKPQ